MLLSDDDIKVFARKVMYATTLTEPAAELPFKSISLLSQDMAEALVRVLIELIEAKTK